MKRGGRRRAPAGPSAGPGLEWIGGRNACLEVLRAGRRTVHRLWVAPGARESGTLVEILRLAQAQEVPVDRSPDGPADSAGASHGVAVEAEPYPYLALEDALALAHERDQAPLLLVLDEIQDPQNLGTLLRTAEAVGVHGVVVPFRRSAGVTPAVVRASSGASEHLVVAAENLGQALARLADAGVRVVGLEAEPAATPIGDLDLTGSQALVVGSEGAGLRRLVRERCDVVARLPVGGRVGSLNAAVAGSIALYLAWEARRAGSQD